MLKKWNDGHNGNFKESTEFETLAFKEGHSASPATTLRLVRLWLQSDRVVWGDLWFASVAIAQALNRCRMRFIGVVKIGTHEYAMEYVSEIESATPEDHVSVVSKTETDSSELVTFRRMHGQSRSFMNSCSMISSGEVVTSTRWKRRSDVTKKVQIHTPILRIAQDYYKTCVAKLTGIIEIAKMH